MKYVKILGLAAVAAMALVAFAAGSASATVLKNNGNNMGVNEVLDASVTQSALLKTTGEPGTTIATCTSGTVKGKITNAGSAGNPVEGQIEENETTGGIWDVPGLTWGNCNTTVDTLRGGTLKLNWTSGNNGTVTSSGAQVTINVGGISCTFGTNNTSVGTVTGGNPAVFDINGIIPKVAGSFLCPADGVWSGQYTVTSPTGTLHVANS